MSKKRWDAQLQKSSKKFRLFVSLTLAGMVIAQNHKQDDDRDKANNFSRSRCSINCEICSVTSDQCVQCFQGFGLKDGTCQPCEDKFCKSCDDDQSTCSECVVGFHLKEIASKESERRLNICLPCMDGCKSCLIAEHCIECRSFFQGVSHSQGETVHISECKLRLWILLILLVPLLVCLGMSFAFEDNWVENVLKKSKPS